MNIASTESTVAASAERRELRAAEMPDDRRVDEHVERLGRERAERGDARSRKISPVVRRAEAQGVESSRERVAPAGLDGPTDRTTREPDDWASRLDHDLVDVDVQRPGEREQDAVGDLVRGDRVEALVHRVGLPPGPRSKRTSENSVSTSPASTVVILIGRPSRSSRSAYEKPRTANFDAMYEAPCG